MQKVLLLFVFTLIFVQNNRAQWIPQNSGTTNSLTDVYFVDGGTGWVVGSFGIILKTVDGGTTWYSQTSGVTNHLTSIYFLDDNNGWTVGQGGIILRTTHAGVSWTMVSIGGFVSLSSVFFFDDSTGWAVGTGGKILKTTNGNYWSQQASGTTVDLRSVFFINENLGWAVGDGGKILVTANGGTPVELLSFSCSVVDNDVMLSWTTATETNNSGFEILRGVYPANSGTQNNDIWSTIGFVPGFGTTTEPKSYSFIDEDVSTGTYNYRLKQIDFDGSFEYSNEIEVVVDFTPKEFVLYQNYPNPFNPSTVISYQLPVNGDVTLKVYDVLGNEIATLVNEEKQPGVYEVEFDASSFASGMYLYKLQSGTFVQTNKMILLK